MSKLDFDICATYASLMEEIKARLDFVHPLIRSLGQDGGKPDDYVHAETCILQVRFVCELVALAALAAHHDQGLTKDLWKSWNADKTFRALAGINPNCFPKQAMIERKDGAVHIQVSADLMDRTDLQKIYTQCGEMLHRGVVKHILSGKERVYDLEAIDKWAGQIGQLLSTHAILILETGRVLIVNMTGGPGGKVHVATAQGGPAVYRPPEKPDDPKVQTG